MTAPLRIAPRLVLLAALLLPELLFAGGWTQKKGEGYFALNFQSTRARDFFGPDGDIIPINGAGTLLGNYLASFYGEYGLSDRVTAIAWWPFFVRNTVNEGVGDLTGQVLQPGLARNGIGDLDLGARVRIYKKGPFVLSGSVFLGLPTGIADDPELLHTGDGEFNQRIQVEAGYGKSRWYTTGYLGFNHRTQGFSEEFRYEGEIGWFVVPARFLVGFKLTGVESFQNGIPSTRGNGLFSNNVEYLSPQFFLAWETPSGWGLSARAGGAIKAQNALAAPGLEAGVFYKLRRKEG